MALNRPVRTSIRQRKCKQLLVLLGCKFNCGTIFCSFCLNNDLILFFFIFFILKTDRFSMREPNRRAVRGFQSLVSIKQVSPQLFMAAMQGFKRKIFHCFAQRRRGNASL